MLQILTDDQKIALFLDWVNNFVTLENFAACYRIDESLANDIINQGRELNNKSKTL